MTIGLPELAHRAATGRYSRLPVYEGDLDHILGVVHAKDVLRLIEKGMPAAGAGTFDVRAITRTVPFVPESMPLDELMAELRRQKSHLAIVIDEFDPPREPVELLPDGGASLDGLLPIEEVNERFRLGIEEPFYDTLGGYIFGQLGRAPVVGDEVALPDGRRLRVEELDGLRVSRVLLLPASDRSGADTPVAEPEPAA